MQGLAYSKKEPGLELFNESEKNYFVYPLVNILIHSAEQRGIHRILVEQRRLAAEKGRENLYKE